MILIPWLVIPGVLFYAAFYSDSTAFKNAVNGHVEWFYLLFILLSLGGAATAVRFFKQRQKPVSLDWLKAVVILYSLFLILISTARFVTYKSEAIDVNFFKTELTQLSSFSVPEFAWAQHFSPILIFLLPLFWLSKSGAWLMLIQSTAVVSGAIPLYLAAKLKLKSDFLGLALVIAYLTFGGLQFGYAYGWHEILFLPPLLFWMYYFWVSGRFKRYWLFLVLALMVKEEVSFIIVFWGLYLIYLKRFRLAGATILVGVLWYLLCFWVVFPHFNPGAGFGYWDQYPDATVALKHPEEILKRLVTPKYKLNTLIHSFGHFAFLSFLSPATLIIVIPSLMEKLLSDNIAGYNGFHYSAAIAAVVLLSVIESLAKFATKRVFFGTLIIYMAVLANILYGYHPLSPLLINKEPGLSSRQVKMLNQAVDFIPLTASVSAQYYIRSHLDQPYWQTNDGPGTEENADYVIVNSSLPLVMAENDYLKPNLIKLIDEGRYELLIHDSGTMLFKRK
jgi:uncharacterized membrane protein